MKRAGRDDAQWASLPSDGELFDEADGGPALGPAVDRAGAFAKPDELVCPLTASPGGGRIPSKAWGTQ